MLLEDFLKEHKLTCKEMAVYIGLDPSMMHRIMKKKCMPTLPVAFRIVHATDGLVTYKDLLNTDEQPLSPLFKQDVAQVKSVLHKMDQMTAKNNEEMEKLQAQILELQSYLTSETFKVVSSSEVSQRC